MERLNEIVAKNLIKYRQIAGLTQIELAKKINYSDKSISKWERGDAIPDFEVIVKLSEIFKIDINEFINDKTDEQKIIIAKKDKNKKHILISLLSFCLVWFVATIVFVVLAMINSTVGFSWLSFIYAVPVSFIVLLVFSLIWGKYYLSGIFSSLILWGIVISVCLTCNNSKIWMLCFVAAVFEVLIIFWFIFRNKFLKKKKKY